MLLDNWLAVTAVPVTGWAGNLPVPQRTDHGRTVLTWRLTIYATGVFEHHHPEPVVVRTSLTTMGTTRGHTITAPGATPLPRLHWCAVAGSGRVAGNTVVVHRASSRFAITIEDPDEWVVLDNPTLS